MLRSRVGSALLLLLCAASSAHAQKLQWSDVVYVPGRWQAGRIVPPSGQDTLAMVMRVDYFGNAPRWRAEVRRSNDGVNLADPVILIGEKLSAVVVTPLGTTPLDTHAFGKDALMRALVVFDADGKRTGAASGPIIDRTPAGAVWRVAFRRTVRTPTFSDDNLNPRNQTAGRQIISNSLVAVGNQRSATVVATAGARGVDKVRTAKGEISVTPNPAAVTQMEKFSVSALRLEDFVRAGKLGPYKMPTT